MWRLIRPFLFLFDAEKIHYVMMGIFSGMMRWGWLRRRTRAFCRMDDPALRTQVLDMEFPSPIGLAAGFDKDARWYNALSALGFGFIEVGSLTAHAQPGNPTPRLFRLPKDQAVLNRFGFNNDGAAAAAKRLSESPAECPLGINIGKSKVAPNEDAVEDYLTSLREVQPYADYLVVNVSSPNTEGLRDLQAEEPLRALLGALLEENARLSKARDARRPPLFVKFAPDMDDTQIEMSVALVRELGVDGIVCTNTTVSRDDLTTDASEVEALGAGGVSGAPLTERSLAFVRKVCTLADGDFPVIGVGGIMDADDAIAMLEAGASAVQIYTGFIYGGPLLVRRMNRAIIAHNAGR